MEGFQRWLLQKRLTTVGTVVADQKCRHKGVFMRVIMLRVPASGFERGLL